MKITIEINTSNDNATPEEVRRYAVSTLMDALTEFQSARKVHDHLPCSKYVNTRYPQLSGTRYLREDKRKQVHTRCRVAAILRNVSGVTVEQAGTEPALQNARKFLERMKSVAGVVTEADILTVVDCIWENRDGDFDENLVRRALIEEFLDPKNPTHPDRY